MDDLIKTISSDWSGESGATVNQLRQVETAFGFKLPDDYKKVMLWSNGGEGPIGSAYLSLWATQKIKKLNEDYQIRKYLPHMVAIGTDRGGKAFALDYSESDANPTLIQVPLGDLDVVSVTFLGRTLREWIEKELKP